MTSLTTEPPIVRTLGDLLAMARAIEREAACRYRGLADRMRLRGADDLAALFDFLSGIEDKHAAAVDRWAAELTGGGVAPPPAGWDVPESFDEEEGASRLLTPYRALAVAVRNEDRAFAFYSYVAAHAATERIAEVAETLAKDELEHAFLLRRERRKAFHAARSPRREATVMGVAESLADLWLVTAEAEGRAARYHRALARELTPTDPSLGALFAAAADDEDACAGEASSHGADIATVAAATSAPTMEGGLRLLEEAFDRYADIAERTRDEAVKHQAQLLSERAVRRLGLVRGAMAESADRDLSA